MKGNGLKIHRISSWLLALFALLTVYTGYDYSRRWLVESDLLFNLHITVEWLFIGFLVFHIILSSKYWKMKFKRLIKGIKSRKAAKIHWLRLIQQITKWAIVILALLVVLSGLTEYPWFASLVGDFVLFKWHIDYDLFLTIAIIIHVAVGFKFLLIRRRVKRIYPDFLIIILSGLLITAVIFINLPQPPRSPQVTIGNTTYLFEPSDVSTLRPDLFGNDSFSMFDIIAHLDSRGSINANYHYNASLNTYVIDSINGIENWWYHAYYSGGYVEDNVYRMDHYLWKPDSTLILYNEDPSIINSIYTTFKEEVDRLMANNGTTIIPTITINGRTFNLEFYNVTIVPHNLRNTTLQDGVITAIDVILTLGDLGNITYDLEYFETLGAAGYVHSYWVARINSDAMEGRCGFVYEEGDRDFEPLKYNYIQVPADTRILNSPEYVRYYWKCL